jgi:uncharacterized membrane protein
MTETHKRTILRAITWRITATIITGIYTGLAGAIIINIWMTFAHYIHERLWLKVKWGKVTQEQENEK